MQQNIIKFPKKPEMSLMDTVICIKCMIDKKKKGAHRKSRAYLAGDPPRYGAAVTLLLFGARLLIAYGLAAFRSYSVV